MSLSEQELKRYNRQILLPELGLEGQRRLCDGKVLVVGAGGLGSPALLYLAAAGVGTLGIVDADRIDESNLQRQILYNTNDVGLSKTAQAAARLSALNPTVKVVCHPVRLVSENALQILTGYDIIIDGTDNLPTRYLINDACVLLGKPLVYGAVFQFEGHVSVFNELTPEGTRGPNYRDLFPQPPPPEMVPSCNEGGVLGVLPGIIGTMQANEAIKLLTGIGESLSGRLMIFDSLGFTTRFLHLRPRADNPISGVSPSITTLIDYEEFCQTGHPSADATQEEITPAELKRRLDAGSTFQFIDVRELYEYECGNLAGLHIPLAKIPGSLDRIDKTMTVIVHCKSGQRSLQALRLLRKEGFSNVLHLKGGLLQWQHEVDPDLNVY